MKKHFAAAYLLLTSAGYPLGAPSHGKCNVAPADLPTQRIVDDMHKKKTADILSLYETNAVFIDPDGKRFRGTAALRSLYQRVFATLDSDIVMTGKHWSSPDANTCMEAGRYE